MEGKIYIHKNEWPLLYEETLIIGNGAAYCHLTIYPHNKDIVYLEAVSVVEEMRHKGLGNFLLGFAIPRAVILGAQELRLSALADSFVVEWYKKYGFRVVETNEEFVNMSLKL